MFLTQRKVIMAKIETTEGTDSMPAAVDVIDCRNAKFEDDSTFEKKDTHRPTLSDQGGFITEIKGKISFEIDLKASGSVGAQSQLGRLLLACGFEERLEEDVNEVVTGLVYLPVSAQASMKTITIYEYTLGDNSDAILRKLVGARGTYTMSIEAGKKAKVQFNFEGRYIEPIDMPNPTIIASNFESSLPAIVENASFKYDDDPYVCRGITLNCQNTLYPLPDMNSGSGILKTLITDRSISGTMSPDIINIAIKNFYAIWKANTKAEISLKVGSVAGNIIEITVPSAQLEKINIADDAGSAYREIPFIATGDDDNELKFILR